MTTNTRKNEIHVILCILFIFLWSTACKKGSVEIRNGDRIAPSLRSGSLLTRYPDITVNWDNWTSGSTYTVAMARQDFGNIEEFTQDEQARCYISTGKLRVTLLKNLHGEDGGVITKMKVPDNEAYELTYKVRFHTAFDWAQGGGRTGFGLLVGDGIMSGGDATIGGGGSFRLGWEKGSNGDVYFYPYVYYKDQAGDAGDDFGVRFPASGSIQRGVWYNIKMTAESNTYKNYNGKIKLFINDTLVYQDTTFRWTSDYEKRLFNYIIWSNYRSGSNSESSTDGLIYFDDFQLKDTKDVSRHYYSKGTEYNYQQYVDGLTGTYYYLTRINHLDDDRELIPLQLASTIKEDSGETVSEFAHRIGSTLAFNASTQRGTAPPMVPLGVQIINGVIRQELSTGTRYTLGIKYDNQLVAYPPGTTASAMLADSVKHALTAFIPLIVNYQSVSDSVLVSDDVFTARAQRQIIAQFANKDLLFLSSSGRDLHGEGPGFTASDVVRILEGQNVKFAYMLDGGGSVGTAERDSLLTKYNEDDGHAERLRPSFLYIKKD